MDELSRLIATVARQEDQISRIEAAVSIHP